CRLQPSSGRQGSTAAAFRSWADLRSLALKALARLRKSSAAGRSGLGKPGKPVVKVRGGGVGSKDYLLPRGFLYMAVVYFWAADRLRLPPFLAPPAALALFGLTFAPKLKAVSNLLLAMLPSRGRRGARGLPPLQPGGQVGGVKDQLAAGQLD